MDTKHQSNVSKKRKFQPTSFTRSFDRSRKKRARQVLKTSSTAFKALNLVRKLQRAREVKVHDILFNVQDMKLAGTVIPLSDVAQGDTGLLRDGRSLSAFWLSVRWHVFRVTPDADSSFRVIIMRDTRQIDNTAPTVAMILREPHPASQLDLLYRTRFHILYDFTSYVDNSSFKIRVGAYESKIKVKVDYSGPAAGNVTKNGLYMLIISSEDTDFPQFQFTSRLLYNDY